LKDADLPGVIPARTWQMMDYIVSYKLEVHKFLRVKDSVFRVLFLKWLKIEKDIKDISNTTGAG
jgi:hypothetical protein